MKRIIGILIIIFLTSCGFEVVKQLKFEEYYISKIDSVGDKKINYIIKNKLLNFSSNVNKKPLTLEMTTNKYKSIKEKNIKNEITKYQIKIEISIIMSGVNTANNQITISETGEYSVNTQHSQTINNEKKLIETLASSLSENLILELSERLNDI